MRKPISGGEQYEGTYVLIFNMQTYGKEDSQTENSEIKSLGRPLVFSMSPFQKERMSRLCYTITILTFDFVLL